MQDAGKLRSRVSIEGQSITRNTYGEEIRSWDEEFKLWGNKIAIRGDTLVRSQQMNLDAQYQYQLRYDSRLTTKHRIRENGSLYDVVWIDASKKYDGEMVALVKESK